MTLRTEKITADTRELNQVKELYEISFPPNERRPFEDMLLDKTGHIEILAFYDEDAFCGFSCLINTDAISHIIYLAIKSEYRDKGYGSQVLAIIRRQKEGKRIIVDIERLNKNALNNAQRRKRKDFYLRNGYEETEVKYRWEDEDYEILSCGGTLSNRDFEEFWDQLDVHIRRNY